MKLRVAQQRKTKPVMSHLEFLKQKFEMQGCREYSVPAGVRGVPAPQPFATPLVKLLDAHRTSVRKFGMTHDLSGAVFILFGELNYATDR